MATTTTNLDLTKPATSDYYNINVYNSNLDKIDTAITKSQPKTGTISLGNYVTGAILTSSGTELYFSIPTGRILPSFSSISFGLIARATNPNGTGFYIVKNTSGGYNAANITVTPTTGSGSFYNADNAEQTITSAVSSLEGETNIDIRLTATYGGSGVNNNPCVCRLENIVITL